MLKYTKQVVYVYVLKIYLDKNMVVSSEGVTSKERATSSPGSIERKPKGLRSKDGCLTCRIRRKVIVGAFEPSSTLNSVLSRNVTKENKQIHASRVVACTLNVSAIRAIVQSG